MTKTSVEAARISPFVLIWRATGEKVCLVASSGFKICVGWLFLAITGPVFAALLCAALPFRLVRIKMCNYFGKIVGPFFLWLSGCKLTLKGRRQLNRKRPAIYISNHTSLMDIFLAIWLSPVGTVGISKRSIIYYPIVGQLYFLSGHVRIARKNWRTATASLRQLGNLVRNKGLSIFMWPEGTRSRSGRLLAFKKGVVHLAIQAGLPVVPIVVKGAHRCWQKRAYTIRKAPIDVEIQQPVDTSGWSVDSIDEAIEEIHARFRCALPDEQQSAAV